MPLLKWCGISGGGEEEKEKEKGRGSGKERDEREKKGGGRYLKDWSFEWNPTRHLTCRPLRRESVDSLCLNVAHLVWGGKISEN